MSEREEFIEKNIQQEYVEYLDKEDAQKLSDIAFLEGKIYAYQLCLKLDWGIEKDKEMLKGILSDCKEALTDLVKTK